MEVQTNHNLESLKFTAQNMERERALSSLKALDSSKNGKNERLWEAAKGFESMFLSQMVKAMRKTLPENDFNQASQGRKIFTEMLDGEYAKMAAGQSENGLAGMLYRQLLLNREMGGGSGQGQTTSWVKVDAPHPVPGSPDSKQQNYQLSDNELLPLIEKAADEFGVDSLLVKSVIRAESGGRPWAVSGAGAKGLMQIMDETARELGVSNVYDPEENIRGGAKYLKSLLEKYDGNEILSLAAYNAGPGTVEKYGGIPPYRETQNYIKKVMETLENLRLKDKEKMPND